MSDLEEIKKKKLEELQRQQASFQEGMQEEAALQQQLSQLESLVKANMTREAIERYGNLKSAHPEKASNVLMILAQAIQQSQVTKITDDMFKDILIKLTPHKREFNIRRK